jgi:hypothetical protein
VKMFLLGALIMFLASFTGLNTTTEIEPEPDTLAEWLKVEVVEEDKDIRLFTEKRDPGQWVASPSHPAGYGPCYFDRLENGEIWGLCGAERPQ